MIDATCLPFRIFLCDQTLNGIEAIFETPG